VDNNEDKYQKNSLLARRKEEATLEAKHEIKNLILKEMTLKSEVNRPRKRSSWRQEFILEAKHEIKNLILKEMTLKSEVNMLKKRSSWRQEATPEAKH
jgi:hypothetical protein